MKKIGLCETEHSKLNDKTRFFIRELDKQGICFKFKLADRLKERNLTVRDCAKITGLRIATISDLMNGNKSSINLHHLIIIMSALKISKIEDIIEVYIPEEIKNAYDNKSEEWINCTKLSKPFNIIEATWGMVGSFGEFSEDENSTNTEK